jgi:cytochrome P450
VAADERAELVRVLRELVTFDADELGWPKDRAQMGARVQAMVALVERLVAHKRQQPADDILSAIVQARDNSDRLDETERVFVGIFVVSGGSGRDRSADELWRLDRSLNTALPRFTYEDVRIGDTLIAKGEIVMAGLLAANHDCAQYAAPNQLELERGGDAPQAFGHGPHLCLDSHLADMTAAIGFRHLIARFPRMKLALSEDLLVRRKDLLIQAASALPVRAARLRRVRLPARDLF